MTRQATLDAIKNARTVYVWVNVTRDDGCYVKTSKAIALAAIRDFCTDLPVDFDGFRCTIHDDGDVTIS